MIEYSQVRYLLAKQPVDDRALNRQVLEVLRVELAGFTRRPRVLELGAGVGTMVSRLADWGVLGAAEYTLIDRDTPSLKAARQHLEEWGQRSSFTALEESADTLLFSRGAARLRVQFVQADLFGFLERDENKGAYDLVIANAVLDLFDLEPTLPRIWRVLSRAGAFWFTINFDGETLLLPELPGDALIVQKYHDSMTRAADPTRAGHPQTGRRMLTAIPASGATLLAAGASDWVVFPRSGAYPGDEAYFLHHIVDTIRAAGTVQRDVPAAELEAWVSARHAQIENRELCYVAHQLDVFGRVP